MEKNGVPEGMGYLLMDVVGVLALVALMAWGVWRYRKTRRGAVNRPTDDPPNSRSPERPSHDAPARPDRRR